MRRAITAGALAILAVAGSASGDEGGGKRPRPGVRELRLTLRESIHLALNHNLDIELARYQPWIEDQSLLSAYGSFDHVLYAEGSGGRTRIDATTLLAGAETLVQDDSLLRTGVRRTLGFGLQYDLFLSVQRTDTNSTFALLDPQWQESAGARLTMPLLRGAGETVQTAPVLLARNARQLSVAQLERSLVVTIFAVQEAYWELVLARDRKRFGEESRRAAERLLEDNRRRFERGVLARVDVTQAEAGVAAQDEGILVAEAAVQNAQDRLKRLIDPSLLRQEVEVVTLDEPRGPEGAWDAREAVESGLREALERRPEVREVLTRIESQRVRLEKAEADALPRLDVVASGSLLGVDDAFGPSAANLREADTFSWSVLLSLELPLENRAARGARQRAELERRRLELERRSLEDRILLEVREAVREVATAAQRIEATRRALALAREQFEGEEARRDVGLRTTFHVLDARSRLTEAQVNEARARIDHERALAAFRRATGRLLAQYDVLVEPNLAPRHAVR